VLFLRACPAVDVMSTAGGQSVDKAERACLRLSSPQAADRRRSSRVLRALKSYRWSLVIGLLAIASTVMCVADSVLAPRLLARRRLARRRLARRPASTTTAATRRGGDTTRRFLPTHTPHSS
jgi:hypothetical protein